jgi:hypothetical protein
MPGIKRCGHCRNEGHNRTKCTKLQVDIVLNIHGRHQERYITPLHHCLMLSKINLDRLAQVKLLIDGQIPFMIFRRYCTYPVNNFMVCLDPTNNELTVTIVEPNPEVEEIAKNALIENAETITNYTNEYKRRIQHVKQGCIYWNYQRINNVITILTGDYIEFTRRVGDEQRAREAAYQQRVAERIINVNNVNQVINREILPIIRNTPIEADDCPICLDELVQTGKTILRCGHQVCINCIVTQTLRSAAIKSTRDCICPVCRTPFV